MPFANADNQRFQLIDLEMIRRKTDTIIFSTVAGRSVRFLLNNQTPDAPDASGKVSVCIPLDPVYPCRYLAANSSIGTGFE